MDFLYSVNSKEFRLRNDTELMQELSWITTGALMEVFLSPQHHKSLPNLPTATLGGKQLWDSLWEVDGWQIQKCRVLGSLIPHYRILDPKGVRRAWYLSRKDFTRDARLFANIIRQKLVMRDFRYGIVFSGGGGKGAYQIGVWKYLHELGIDQKIHGVSGASVGALNSLLFLQGDYQKAEELWANIRQDDFTRTDPLNYLKAILDFLSPASPLSSLIKQLIERMQNSPEQGRDISFSLFSRKRLRELIDTYIDSDQVQKNLSDKLVYSMLCEIPLGANPASLFVKYPYVCCWKNRDFEEIRELVLTSAAFPGAYPIRTFDGRVCVDGGAADNLPVAPLLKEFHHIIVIHLNPKGDKEEKAWAHATQKVQTDTYHFYHVYPSKAVHMDNLADTMTVNPELTQYRMALGYHDAKEQLRPLVAHEKSRMPIPNGAQANAVLPAVRAIW